MKTAVTTVGHATASGIAFCADPRSAAHTGVPEQVTAIHQRHPWTLYVATGRAVLGPNALAFYEASLRHVVDLGLPARDAVAMVDSQSMYVRGAARDAVEATRAPEATGKSELDWWQEREPVLEQVLSEERFPTLTRLGAEGGFDVPEDEPDYNLRFILDDFEFGLQRLLDGFEAFIAARDPAPVASGETKGA